MSVTAPDGSVWPAGSLRALEHMSIREFVLKAAKDGYFGGVVLDYGAGRMPYREIVESGLPLGGSYQPFDQARFPGNDSGENLGEGDPLVMQGWGTILCTQVLQYIPDVEGLLGRFRNVLREGGHLILTYPTNWPEAQAEDLHRFTKTGMERLLTEAGFTIIRHERRAEIKWDVDTFALGYGCIARA